VAEAVGYVGRHSRVHCRERSAVEGEGLKKDCVGGMKNETLVRSLSEVESSPQLHWQFAI
jgi:hypothetical protein